MEADFLVNRAGCLIITSSPRGLAFMSGEFSRHIENSVKYEGGAVSWGKAKLNISQADGRGKVNMTVVAFEGRYVENILRGINEAGLIAEFTSPEPSPWARPKSP